MSIDEHHRERPIEELSTDFGLPSEQIELGQVAQQHRRLVAQMFGIQAKHERLGHYRVLNELGRGGMGVVHVAHDTKLDRKVAVKQLLRSDHPRQRDRFLREALAMAKVSHPNVIPVYEIGETEDSVFIVMEYIEGSTLRDWLAIPRPRAEVLTVFMAAARGLIAAHKKGLVHRDFKPANVMVGDDGRVRVMDFGLARGNANPVDSDAETLAASEVDGAAVFDQLTQTGTILGTPAYMSPEQLLARVADVASDQFSFCVALYEGLYGERPFAGQTFDELRVSVLGGELRDPPSETTVPNWLRALVCRGLALRAEDRFESLRELLDAIIEGQAAHDPIVREPPEYVFVAHAPGDKLPVLRLCRDLIAAGVRPWLDMWDLSPRGDREAEQRAALRNAPAVLVCEGPQGSGDADMLLREEIVDGRVYRVGLPGWPRRSLDGDGLAGVDLDEASWDDAVWELAALIGPDRNATAWSCYAEQQTGGLEPYRGLEAFAEEHARWMFGRDTEIEGLLEKLATDECRLLTVVGSSGAGKSSLIMGGVVPALRCGALGDGRKWQVVYLRPGKRPCESLARAISMLQLGPSQPPDYVGYADRVSSLTERLLQQRERLRLIVTAMCASEAGVLVVVDQLEELLTEAEHGAGERASKDAAAFLANLVEATDEVESLRVVMTLRADFFHRCLELPDLAIVLQAGAHIVLPPMSADQIRAAVELPVRLVGYALAQGLADILVAGTAEQPGRLPLLQHVLRELWEKRDAQKRRLTMAAYHEIGGLEGAIASAADRGLRTLMKEFSDASKVTRRLMTRLVHLGKRGSGDTRRRATRTSLPQDEATVRALEVFVSEERVIVGSKEGDEEVLEIAHEALLREWTTLVEWLDCDRGALIVREEIERDARRMRQAWEAIHGQTVSETWKDSKEYLWGEGRVLEARRVIGESTVDLNEVERNFLDMSEAVAKRMRRRVRAGVVTAFVILAVFVGVVSGLAVHNARIARENQDLAEKRRIEWERAEQATESERAQGFEVQEALRAQKGLRASMLADARRTQEALLVAIEGVGGDGGARPPALLETTRGMFDVATLDPWGEVATLEGHSSIVTAVAFSPDGSSIATASADNSVRLWDDTGKFITSLEGHSDSVTAVVFSPDGSSIATASSDNSARLWDASGKFVNSLEGHTDSVTSVVFSPDGSSIATASFDSSARLWDTASGKLTNSLEGHSSIVTAVAFSPDGSSVATTSFDNSARLWDATSGLLIASLKGHSDVVTTVAFSPDGFSIATASWDNSARLWDAASGRFAASLEGHSGSVTAVVFSPDGSSIATASSDNSARLWDATSGKLTASLEGHSSIVTGVAFSPDGSSIATASDDSTARLWDAASGKVIASLEGHTSRVTSVAFPPNGSSIATASIDHTARLWDARTGKIVASLRGHSSTVTAVAFSPDGSSIATASDDNTARLWDAASGKVIASFEGHTSRVTAVAFSPDGSSVATAGYDNLAQLWDAASGKVIASFEGHSDVVTEVVFSPDGSSIATASDDNTARLWDATSGRPITSLEGHSSFVTAVAFSPDGSSVATGSDDNTARLWDAVSGKRNAYLAGHSSRITAVAFSPDGSSIATASADNSVRLWDAASGKLIVSLEGHSSRVTAVVFSPDGSAIATASVDTFALLWNAASGKLIASLEGHSGSVVAVVFSPDGSSIATASSDKTARLWDAESGKFITFLKGHSDSVTAVAFSPDGSSIATASADNFALVWPAADLLEVSCGRARRWVNYMRVAHICEPLL